MRKLHSCHLIVQQSATSLHARNLCVVLVQTAKGLKSGGLVGSEVAAMMIMAVLPDINQHYLSKGDLEYTRLCRYYEMRHDLPAGSVQYPFPIFFDNARIHAHARLCMAQLWQYTPLGLGKQRSVQDAASAAFYMQKQLKDRLRQNKVNCLAKPLSEEQRNDKRYTNSLAMALLQTTPQFSHPSIQALYAATRQQRSLVESDARCAGFPPHMCGPLVDKTPDINAPAENCVGFLKRAVTDRVKQLMWQSQNEPLLDCALTYEMALREKVQQLNSPDGLLTCKASVLKAPARVKLLAAKEGEIVVVQQVHIRKGKDGEREIVTYHRKELGRNGRWMAKGVFKG